MMSICLQAMVDELMVKKSGGSIKKVSLGLVEKLQKNSLTPWFSLSKSPRLYRLQMLRKRHNNGSVHRPDSQQAVKSPPLLVSSLHHVASHTLFLPHFIPCILISIVENFLHFRTLHAFFINLVALSSCSKCSLFLENKTFSTLFILII